MSDVGGDNRWRIVGRSLTIWLVIIFAEIVHGKFRVVLLAPLVGQLQSKKSACSSTRRFLAGYNIAKGGLMPLGLLILLFGPMIASKLREKR